MTRKNYTFHAAYKNVSASLSNEVCTFWETNNAIENADERKRRAQELACVARNQDGAIAGVGTVFPQKMKYQNSVIDVLTYRTFMKPEDRKPLLFLALFFAACNVLENAVDEGEFDHVAFVTENTKFMRRGVRTQIFEANGAECLGQNSQGFDIWLYPLRKEGQHRKAIVEPS